MNERIKELAEQARDWAEVSYKKQNDQFTSHWDNPIGYTVSQFFEQKFAELVVHQMLEITDAHTEVFQTDRDRALIEHIKQSVKQHFGVE